MGTVTPRANTCRRCRLVILPAGVRLCYFCRRSGFQPACMTADELETYRTGRSRYPCTDCTPEFAAEMKDAGRCNGTPGAIVGRPRNDEGDPLVLRRRAQWREAAQRRRDRVRAA